MALLAIANSQRLSHRVRSSVSSGPNLISVVTYWEVVIKTMKGKLQVGDPSVWWSQALRQLSATELNIDRRHIECVIYLPPIHQDAFDRILIAQATAENLTLLTTDAEVASYASQGYRVIA